MIVVDTNIIGYLFLSSERSSQAEQVYLKDPGWAAPLLWRSELRNVLAHYLRKEILSLSDALQIMDSATRLMAGREYEVRSLHVLEIVAESSCSAYDCEFVALARELDVPHMTVDRQVLDQFPSTAISMESFLDS